MNSPHGQSGIRRWNNILNHPLFIAIVSGVLSPLILSFIIFFLRNVQPLSIISFLGGITKNELNERLYSEQGWIAVQASDFSSGIFGQIDGLTREIDPSLSNGAGKRTITGKVKFKQRFSQKPNVIIGLTHIDIDNRFYSRLNVKILNVSNEEFSYEFATWEDTRVYGAAIHWFAYQGQNE